MDRVRRLNERLAAGERVLIDGGTGTEIERRGGSMVDGAWCGVASLTNPDIVQEVHEDYLKLGAEVIIANNYATARHILDQAGWGDRVEELNRAGIHLAQAARAAIGHDNALVAGSISVTEQGYPPPSLETLAINLAEAARLQAEAGADLILLEMMRSLVTTEIAMTAVEATGLPVWLGWSCELIDGVPHLIEEGGPLADATKWASDRGGIDVMSIMHTETVDVAACVDVLRSHWNGPIGVYAHTGDFQPPHWIFDGTISPADYSAAAAGWLDQGVQVIGGCCGIGPEHIRDLSAHLA